MGLPNRVTPLGELIAAPERGLVYGNRGCLHDESGRIRRRYNGKRWIACRLEFRGWRRSPLLQPGRFTELFFLDEATAFAAGHRPCALCRREDYVRFLAICRSPFRPGRRGFDRRAHLHSGGSRRAPATSSTTLCAARRAPRRCVHYCMTTRRTWSSAASFSAGARSGYDVDSAAGRPQAGSGLDQPALPRRCSPLRLAAARAALPAVGRAIRRREREIALPHRACRPPPAVLVTSSPRRARSRGGR